MKGFRFYAVMPDERKSKSANNTYPFQPWTRATLKRYADEGRYVECLATFGEPFLSDGSKIECIGALQEGNSEAVCISSASVSYLRERCTSIDEATARKLHPALLRYLEARAMARPEFTHRIRRCEGNKQAWCLVALRSDGTEIDSFGGYTTATSIDSLLRFSRGLLPTPDDVVQIVYYTSEEQASL